MAATDISPLEPIWSEMKRMTMPDYEIRDCRGPLVFEVTCEPNLNGTLPEIMQDGVNKLESMENDAED